MFSSVSVRPASCQARGVLFEAVGLMLKRKSAFLAGCSLGQIRSLIHEGERREERGNGRAEPHIKQEGGAIKD